MVAGDLLDSDDRGYRELDDLLHRERRVRVLALPGNHDARLRQELFAAGCIRVFSRPALRRIDGRPVLFLPYQEGRSMGAAIEESGLSERLPADQWVLVSHGDFAAPRRAENGEEDGYFPLTRADLGRLRPARVVLGHIHVPGDLKAAAVAPGSPYPLSPAERGPRRLLLLDTDTLALRELPLAHTPVFLEARIWLLPDGREIEQLRQGLREFLDAPPPQGGAGLGGRLALRVSLLGYSSTRSGLEREAEAVLAERGVRLESLQAGELEITDDTGRAVIAQRVRRAVADLHLDYPDAAQLREQVLARALRLVCAAEGRG